MAVKPIPDGYHSVTPYLIIKGAADALKFYARAFGATELFRMPTPDGRITAWSENWIRSMLRRVSVPSVPRMVPTLSRTTVVPSKAVKIE